MLDLLGTRYVIDHAVSVYNERQRREAYRVYMTDSIKAAVENTAHFAGGVVINVRYDDIVRPKAAKEEPSAEEVKESIKAKFR